MNSKIIKAVIDQLDGAESLKDIYDHGASGGYTGFTMYSETVKFHDDNEDEIWDLLYEESKEMGDNILEMIASFICSKNVGSMNQLKNLLSWYALESVARHEIERRDK